MEKELEEGIGQERRGVDGNEAQCIAVQRLFNTLSLGASMRRSTATCWVS